MKAMYHYDKEVGEGIIVMIERIVVEETLKWRRASTQKK